MEFDIPVDQRVRIREGEKIKKYLDLARELKQLWKRKVTMILIIAGALGTVLKALEREMEQLEIEGLTETLQTTAFLDQPEYSL